MSTDPGSAPNPQGDPELIAELEVLAQVMAEPDEPGDDRRPCDGPTDYTNPATIDVDVVIGEINQAHRMRGHTWTDRLSWPNVTVAALAAEVERLRGSEAALRRAFDVAQQAGVELWAEVERLRAAAIAAEQEADQLRPLVKLHQGAHVASVEAFIGMGDAVMTAIADGQTMAEVLDIVGDWLSGRDAIDEDSEALFDRAKAAALRAAATDGPVVGPEVRSILAMLAKSRPVTTWQDSDADLNGNLWCAVCKQIAPAGAARHDDAWHTTDCAWARTRRLRAAAPASEDDEATDG